MPFTKVVSWHTQSHSRLHGGRQLTVFIHHYVGSVFLISISKAVKYLSDFKFFFLRYVDQLAVQRVILLAGVFFFYSGTATKEGSSAFMGLDSAP